MNSFADIKNAIERLPSLKDRVHTSVTDILCAQGILKALGELLGTLDDQNTKEYILQLTILLDKGVPPELILELLTKNDAALGKVITQCTPEALTLYADLIYKLKTAGLNDENVAPLLNWILREELLSDTTTHAATIYYLLSHNQLQYGDILITQDLQSCLVNQINDIADRQEKIAAIKNALDPNSSIYKILFQTRTEDAITGNVIAFLDIVNGFPAEEYSGSVADVAKLAPRIIETLLSDVEKYASSIYILAKHRLLPPDIRVMRELQECFLSSIIAIVDKQEKKDTINLALDPTSYMYKVMSAKAPFDFLIRHDYLKKLDTMLKELTRAEVPSPSDNNTDSLFEEFIVIEAQPWAEKLPGINDILGYVASKACSPNKKDASGVSFSVFLNESAKKYPFILYHMLLKNLITGDDLKTFSGMQDRMLAMFMDDIFIHTDKLRARRKEFLVQATNSDTLLFAFMDLQAGMMVKLKEELHKMTPSAAAPANFATKRQSSVTVRVKHPVAPVSPPVDQGTDTAATKDIIFAVPPSDDLPPSYPGTVEPVLPSVPDDPLPPPYFLTANRSSMYPAVANPSKDASHKKGDRRNALLG